MYIDGLKFPLKIESMWNFQNCGLSGEAVRWQSGGCGKQGAGRLGCATQNATSAPMVRRRERHAIECQVRFRVCR